MTKRNSTLKTLGINHATSLIVVAILLSIGTQHSVAQTNLSPSASTPLAAASESGGGQREPGTFRLKGAIVKTPPAIKVPGLQAGLLTEVTIKEGGRVTRGQFLAQIDPTETQLSLEQSKLDHELAVMDANNNTDQDYFQKLLVVATAEVNRSIAANNRVNNSVPVAKLEKQKLEQERAALQLQQANRQLDIAKFRTRLTQSQIKTAEVKLAKTKIVSPVNGLIINVVKQPGEWLQQSETVCEIVSVDRLRVEGFATVEQAAQIKTGMPAKVEFQQPWLKSKSVAGTVTFVAPSANPLNLLVPIWVEIENRDQEIIAGVNGDLVIQTDTSPRAQRGVDQAGGYQGGGQ